MSSATAGLECKLLSLPDELLDEILLRSSTPSLVQLSTTCKKIRDRIGRNRRVLLQNLNNVPGIKLGLDDTAIPLSDLFLIFRQRASRHLYGRNFDANAHEHLLRNTSVDAQASSVAELNADCVAMSVVLKESAEVYLYSTTCSLKGVIASPFHGGKVQVLQVVHREFFISVLYQWERDPSQAMSPQDQDQLIMLQSLPATQPHSTEHTDGDKAQTRLVPSPTRPITKRYFLKHYDTVSDDRSMMYTVLQHKRLEPKHLAVETQLQCAILWDEPGRLHPTDSSEILLYTTPKIFNVDSYIYEERVIWPTVRVPRPSPLTSQEIIRGGVSPKAKHIAFFKEGRSLKVYASGEIVPFNVIGTEPDHLMRPPTSMVHARGIAAFAVDTPFFGLHESFRDPADDVRYCNSTHLCLGTAEIRIGNSKCKVLCILRSRSRIRYEGCLHLVDLSSMSHVTAEYCNPVARLWGWSQFPASLTGLETVAISPQSTRIAIAQWDKVLVYSIDPRMLCEDVADVDNDDDEINGKKGRKNKRKHRDISGWADTFYERKRDERIGWSIAKLKPIVLDLKGAVARKMSWIVQDQPLHDNDEEDGVASSSSNVRRSHNTARQTTRQAAATHGFSSALQSSGADFTSLTEEDRQRTMMEVYNHLLEQFEMAASVMMDMANAQANALAQEQEQEQEQEQSSEPTADPTSPAVDGAGKQRESPHPADQPGTGSGPEFDAMITTEQEKAKEGEQEQEKQKEKQKQKKGRERQHHRRKQITEDELMIMTDRGIQLWNLGVWSTGQRTQSWLDHEYEHEHEHDLDHNE